MGPSEDTSARGQASSIMRTTTSSRTGKSVSVKTATCGHGTVTWGLSPRLLTPGPPCPSCPTPSWSRRGASCSRRGNDLEMGVSFLVDSALPTPSTPVGSLPTPSRQPAHSQQTAPPTPSRQPAHSQHSPAHPQQTAHQSPLLSVPPHGHTFLPREAQSRQDWAWTARRGGPEDFPAPGSQGREEGPAGMGCPKSQVWS